MILPNRPFTTADFSSKGGGIDFLGLRWVSLTIVARDLIPELNNVTQDMGIFCLGTWIPWKFKQLCRTPKDYTERNYAIFREKVEVALSMTFRTEANIPHTFGQVRRQIGSTQKPNSPQLLTFKAAKRGPQNTVYAAANYGPALQALGLIQAYRSQSADGKRSPRIPVAGDDQETLDIIGAVDDSLKKVREYSLLANLEIPEATWSDVQHLGRAGLDPACYRSPAFGSLKSAFRVKLLPKSADHTGYARTLTARLIIATLQQREGLSVWDIRHAWYTGRISRTQPLRFEEPALIDQCRRWSCLMARQYQRYPLELFLWCFEDALSRGARSIDDVCDNWIRRSSDFARLSQLTFRQVLSETADELLDQTELATSRAWNRVVVDRDDERFEHIEEAKGDNAVEDALHMLAGWYWRMLTRMEDPAAEEMMKLGGSDRIGMVWFITWLRDRMDVRVTDIVREVFSDLVFAQHMRIALARFDGKSQRLRFLLGDSGIEPAVSARKDFANLKLPWMPDRLHSLVGLLSDCDVLSMRDDKLYLGSAANSLH